VIYTVKCQDCTYASRYVQMSTAHERARDHAVRLCHRAVVTDCHTDTAHDHRRRVVSVGSACDSD
jgi:hypothetical protein